MKPISATQRIAAVFGAIAATMGIAQGLAALSVHDVERQSFWADRAAQARMVCSPVRGVSDRAQNAAGWRETARS